jgi:hypothetical protein
MKDTRKWIAFLACCDYKDLTIPIIFSLLSGQAVSFDLYYKCASEFDYQELS